MRRGSVISFWLAVAFSTALPACATNASPSLSSALPISSSAQNRAPLEVFLVRHAEKTTDKDDPALTIVGQNRAKLLADMLKDAGITHIHSSDYRRTRDTAAPLAQSLGIPVQIYDPRVLIPFAESLITQGGKHLVVGHSNTTPQLTRLLGGEGGAPIIEATEYDRLYVVTALPEGETTTSLLRFGQTIGELKGEAVP